MSKFVTYTEIQCFVQNSPYVRTERDANYILGVADYRFVNVNYRKIQTSKRFVTCQNNPITDDRKALIEEPCLRLERIDYGYQKIPYWIEPGGIVWIKETLQPGESITIRIQNNNPEEADEPNGKDVFVIFDDFDSSALDTGTWVEVSSYSISDSIITCWNADSSTNLKSKTLDQPLQKWIVKYRGKSESSDSRWSCGYADTQVQVNDSCNLVFYEGSNAQWTHFLDNCNSHSELANNDVYNWYTVEISYDGSVGKFIFNGNERLSVNISPSDYTIFSYLRLGSCRKYNYDWVYVAKYEYKDNLQISSTNIDAYTIEYTIKNISTETLTDIQIPLSVGSSFADYGQSIYVAKKVPDVYECYDYLIESDNRFLFTPKAEPGQNIRYAFFLVNAAKIVSSVQIILPLIYSSDRSGFVYTSPYSQRQSCFVSYSIDERLATYFTYKEARLSSPIVKLPLLSYSERKLYIEQNQFTQRYANLTLGANTERNISYYTFQQGFITTPKVELSINDLYSEIHGFTTTEFGYNERIAYIYLTPHNDRYVTFNYTIPSERVSTYITNNYKLLNDFCICQCHPYYNERFATTKGYINATERVGFTLEGSWFAEKKPALSVNPKLTILSTKQTDKAARFYTGQPVEAHVEDGNALSQKIERQLVDIGVLTDKDKVKVTPVAIHKGTAYTETDTKLRVLLTQAHFVARYFERIDSDIWSTYHSGPRYETRHVFAIGGSRWEERLPYYFAYIPYEDERNAFTPEAFIREISERTGFHITEIFNERNVTLVYLATDERNALAKLVSFAYIVDEDGNVYRVYFDEDNNKLTYKESDELINESSKVTNSDKTKAYQLKLVNNEIVVEEVDDDPENIVAPIVTNLDETKKYRLYYDDSDNKLYVVEDDES